MKNASKMRRHPHNRTLSPDRTPRPGVFHTLVNDKMESMLDILRTCAIMMESALSISTNSIHGGNMKNRLEELRKQRGIRQEELAAALEVSRQTIGSLENGRYNPSILLAFKIARYFGVSIEEIFIYEEESI